jgi:flagellar basal body-associated protein FliL
VQENDGPPLARGNRACGCKRELTVLTIILIVLVVLLLFGGGGYWYRGRGV